MRFKTTVAVVSLGLAVLAIPAATANAAPKASTIYSDAAPMSGTAVRAIQGLSVPAPDTLASYPSGWSDEGYSYFSETTLDFKIVVRVQVFRQYASTDYWNTITAARAACSIRKLGDTTGVAINDCVFGIDGGAALTNSGYANDGGTCCANAYSSLRYVDVPPTLCCTGFRARISPVYRNGGTLWSIGNVLSNSTGKYYNLSG